MDGGPGTLRAAELGRKIKRMWRAGLWALPDHRSTKQRRHMNYTSVNFQDKFRLFNEQWQPKVYPFTRPGRERARAATRG